jgi:hypothetical protein
MKVVRLFTIIFIAMMTASSSIALAQDLSAVTRPRRVKELNQQVSSEQIEAKLAIRHKALEPDDDSKLIGAWVSLSKSAPYRQSSAKPQDSQSPASADAATATPQALKEPTLGQVNVGDTRINGKSDPGVKIELLMNDATEPSVETTAGIDGRFRLALPSPIKSSDRLVLKLTKDTQTLEVDVDVVKMMNLTHPNLVGLAPFGIVTSQQADRFSQADPYGGFIIGYMSTARKRIICKQMRDATTKIVDSEVCYDLRESNPGYLIKLEKKMEKKEVGKGKTARKERETFFREYQQYKEDMVAAPNVTWVERNPYKPNLNIRIQGIFESDGRKATAPAAATSTNTGDGDMGDGDDMGDGETTGEGDTPEPGEPVSFIASRKTFDVDLHLWQEYRFRGSPVFHWGPYAAIGGSFALSKNELVGEGVTADTGGGGNSVPLDTSKVSTSNGGKLYYEGGLALNFYNSDPNDSNLYVQAFIALGHYQAYADLRPEANTKWRGVGKLRVFPFGLNRDFFEHGVVSPMFGIDLNAGKGPDQVRFFVGSVLNITKFIDKLKGTAPTAENP